MVRKALLSTVLVFVSIALLASIPTPCWSQPADNTKVNKRDRSQNEMTSDQQGQSKQDVETTRKIRQAIVKDKKLSTYAHNVKIITKDGMVTLKGPVKSEQEKEAVEEKATRVAGKEKVKSEIEVAEKQAKR